MIKSLAVFIDHVKLKNPHEHEFIQSVKEVAHHVIPYIESNEIYEGKKILYRLIEPERIIIFRISWIDDFGNIQINRGFRVQMNSAIGPYKGGIRFHPTVNISILKFLAFEQVFKNSLTTLPLGGGKGGSDFNPKGKSDNEIMRFCQAFILELHRHIGQFTDIPAGDIGVGFREIGYMYGMYKKITNKFTGSFTGKGLSYGGSFIRNEATGYGVTYFVDFMLKKQNKSINGKKILISGSGNVAQYTLEKCLELGGKVITVSDSTGFLYIKNGFTQEMKEHLFFIKNRKRTSLAEFEHKFPEVQYFKNQKPWKIPCDIAIPCATQNEINKNDAQNLINNGVIILAEGSNMSCDYDAINLFLFHKILYAPGKAANAGGVAISGLEMSQNSIRIYWESKNIDNKLKLIMNNIHEQCIKFGKESNGFINYVKGANIAGFIKVAEAMINQGVI